MIPGVGGFSLSCPQFEKIKISLPEGQLSIDGGSIQKYYISSVKLNGKKYVKRWIDWSDLKKGAKLEFATSDNENTKWH